MERVRAGRDDSTVRTGVRPPVLALLELLAAEVTFRTRETGESGARTLRMVEPGTGVRVEVVEEVEHPGAVLVSALAP